jgi:hypothetical protein
MLYMGRRSTNLEGIMSKFTAGPWKFLKGGMLVAQDETEIVGTFHKANGNDANARLIAAAPELYAAIHAILEDAGYLSGEALPQLRELNVTRSKLDAARAALKKARGE